MNNNYLMHSYITCVQKTHFHQKTNISRLFRLNHTKLHLIQHFPYLYRSKVVYDFIKGSFRCFVPFYSHQS